MRERIRRLRHKLVRRHWDLYPLKDSGGNIYRRAPLFRRLCTGVVALPGKLKWLWVAMAGAVAGKLAELAFQRLL